MAKPLKVYYCCDCGCRMPLYYKKDAPYRDEVWHRCYYCHSTNLECQVEEWNYHREKTAKNADTSMQRENIKKSAKLWSENADQKTIGGTSNNGYSGAGQNSGDCPF